MIRPGRAISLSIAGLNIVRLGPALLLGHVHAIVSMQACLFNLDPVCLMTDVKALLTQTR